MTLDDVWNRAAMQAPDFKPQVGDTALANALRFHNMVMSGGPGHALEVLGVASALEASAGLRYFGLDDAAEAIDWVVATARRADLDEDEREDALEQEGGQRYDGAVPTDQVILDAFHARASVAPADFAPVD